MKQPNERSTSKKASKKEAPKEDTLEEMSDQTKLDERLKKILNVAHGVGVNGHPLNDDLLAAQLRELIKDEVRQTQLNCLVQLKVDWVQQKLYLPASESKDLVEMLEAKIKQLQDTQGGA